VSGLTDRGEVQYLAGPPEELTETLLPSSSLWFMALSTLKALGFGAGDKGGPPRPGLRKDVRQSFTFPMKKLTF